MAKRTTTPKTKPGEKVPAQKGAAPRKARPRKSDSESSRLPDLPSAGLSHPTITRLPDVLDVLMVISEARPFAKTGGLADVGGALPRALAALGHRVTIVLPRYRGIEPDGTNARDAAIPFGSHRYPVRLIERTISEGVTAILIDAPQLYDRDGLYGDAGGEYADNAFRFAVLCRGALEYARIAGKRPSVVHAHDWQGALAPVYARTVLGADPIIGGVRTVLTIHNLAFQGQFDPAVLPWIGLGPELYTPEFLEFWGRGSSLKGGVLASDVITTVSPTYAREILTPEYGFGFNGILNDRARDLFGILNGIDVAAWNPATDEYLPTHYDASSLDRKSIVKRALLESLGIVRDSASIKRPAIGLVTRLTQQKGCDLMAAAAERLLAVDATWIVLGSGDGWCEDLWRHLEAEYPGRVVARIGFDEQLAHLIEAGADIFLMPSWYEPCGLNQMYSQRYGTPPVVRATGGLEDTVVDADEFPATGTGFKFKDYTPEAVAGAVNRAVDAFGNSKRWKAIQRRAMKRDFSWDVSAREYVKVYRGETDGIR
jgi:starch synthase